MYINKLKYKKIKKEIEIRNDIINKKRIYYSVIKIQRAYRNHLNKIFNAILRQRKRKSSKKFKEKEKEKLPKIIINPKNPKNQKNQKNQNKTKTIEENKIESPIKTTKTQKDLRKIRNIVK